MKSSLMFPAWIGPVALFDLWNDSPCSPYWWMRAYAQKKPQEEWVTVANPKSAIYSRIVTKEDTLKFAELSGDRNPIHSDPEYAVKTPFGECIAHGALYASYISTIFGMHLPGPGAVYVSQAFNFRAPVKIGDAVDASVKELAFFPKRRWMRYACACHVGSTLVLDGMAVLKLPR